MQTEYIWTVKCKDTGKTFGISTLERLLNDCVYFDRHPCEGSSGTLSPREKSLLEFRELSVWLIWQRMRLEKLSFASGAFRRLNLAHLAEDATVMEKDV